MNKPFRYHYCLKNIKTGVVIHGVYAAKRRVVTYKAVNKTAKIDILDRAGESGSTVDWYFESFSFIG